MVAESFTFDEEKMVVGMHDRGILVFPEGGLKLKSGRISPYYHNMRGMLSLNQRLDDSGAMPFGRQREFIRESALGYATRFDEIKAPYAHVFGKAQAGTAPLAVASFVAGKSYLWERVPEPKDYGMKQRIEGDYDYGDFIHLGDDNVTDGQSKIDGAAVLYEAGLQPVSLTVMFDREEGAQERLTSLGFEMNAVTSLSRVVPILRANGRISEAHVAKVIEYHEELIANGITSTFELSV
ncbi:hypothetical protein A3J32_01270 [Candidatus Saccharibacteria bacterium RIFCSPLOWO2_02_FULL_46_7]|nr:MAG: hypothetical protein A3J32_01270 [Candidatus Saccharibacteria bacterium RIFCSPLOWO2_02_FULL_46_7]